MTRLNPAKQTASTVALAITNDLLKLSAAPGHQLPSERILAERHGVSRGTLRAALGTLEEQSILLRKPGSGTFVNQLPQQKQTDFSDITSPVQLMQVREVIEPAIVEMAVKNAGHRDLKALTEAYNRLLNSMNAHQFSQADEAFHLCLAQASGNPLVLWIYEQINEVRQHDMWRNSRKRVLTTETMAMYNQHHEAIMTAVLERNISGAKKAIMGHLQSANEDLIS